MIEIEIDRREQLESALSAAPDIVLLDNMSNAELSECVAIRDRTAPNVELEASGGVNLRTIAGIAGTGVDRISVGALTHSAPILDIGLDWSLV
jgi:nicotinate-nucleotide pyrophosphorylase (carboxylating)